MVHTLTLICRSVEVKPGQEVKFNPGTSLRITNAALGEELENETARSTIKLTYDHLNTGDDDEDDEDENDNDEDDEKVGMVQKKTILCSLTPGKVKILSILGINCLTMA